MLQQRKKDYLQRLIEEFFKKLQHLLDGEQDWSDVEKRLLLDDCFDFFFTNLGVTKYEKVDVLFEKIADADLLEQYAKLLMIEYDIIKLHKDGLKRSLAIVEYLHETDSTYSWDRVVLKEDILHRLDERST